MKAGQSSHFAELDGMRGVLAVLVMLMHYGMDRIISQASHGVITRCLWELSVDFFFVLSGFVLARSFERSLPTIGGYAVRRILRLGPMFFLAMLAAWACGVPADGFTLIANLLIVQSILGLASINFPSWSIPFELFLPALGILLVSHWGRWSRAATSVAVAICGLGASACGYLLATGHDIRPLRAVLGLGFGFLMYRLIGAQVAKLGGRPVTTGIGFVCIMLIMLSGSRFPLVTLLFPWLVALTIAIGATTRGLMSTAPAQALGRWSYSIYLVHFPVLLVAQEVFGKAAVGHNPVLKMILAFVAVGVGFACHRLVEAPMARLATSYRNYSHPSALSDRQSM